MEDLQIVALYWQRSGTAISESSAKYGPMLHGIAFGILSSREDSEECVNDTYHKAWESMPPQRPNALGAYLGRITRNLSINRFHSVHAQKRGGGAVLLSELGECIPSGDTVEGAAEAAAVAAVIDGWLGCLSPEDRRLFLRRYWFGDGVDTLAAACGTSTNRLASRLYRLRQKLKAVLEQEGVIL